MVEVRPASPLFDEAIQLSKLDKPYRALELRHSIVEA